MEDRKISISTLLRQSLLSVAVLLGSLPALLAQTGEKAIELFNRKNYSEELHVRTDRGVYIAGERVYLKVYCMNGVTHTPSYLSRVAYVSLLDSLNNPVVQVKLLMPGVSGTGQILLPDTISTGNYFIAACTHWMKNFSPDLFAYNKISVINPFQAIDKIRISSQDQSHGNENDKQSLEVSGVKSGQGYEGREVYKEKPAPLFISIKLDKEGYSARERVIVDILATDSEGRPVESDLVLSVAKSFSLANINDKVRDVNSGNAFLQTTGGKNTPAFLPEPDGHLICGTIKNTLSGEPLRNENVVLSFVGKTALCRFTTTDNEGRFKFVTTEFGTREVVIQPLSAGLEEYYVELENPFPDSFSQLPSLPFSLDTARLTEINNAIISMQIRRVYEAFLTDSAKNENLWSKDFYGKPDNTTLMSTFIRLTSLREAIKEIIPGVVTTRKKDKTVINSVFRFKDRITITNPLLLVDGVPVYDHENVLAINLDKIEKVDVLNYGYIFSKIYLDGIIDITTYKGNLSEPVFEKPVFRQEFETLQLAQGFSSPAYSTPEQKESRLPDFRNTLYWNPEIKTDKNGRATVEFYTSDEPGTYTILAEGFTAVGINGKTVTTLRVTAENDLKK